MGGIGSGSSCKRSSEEFPPLVIGGVEVVLVGEGCRSGFKHGGGRSVAGLSGFYVEVLFSIAECAEQLPRPKPQSILAYIGRDRPS